MFSNLSTSSGVVVSLTDISDNSIVGSWDISVINFSISDTRFVTNTTLASNGVLSVSGIYSLSFIVNGTNGTSGTNGSSGTSGSVGATGATGSNGTSGTSGTSEYRVYTALLSQTGTNAPVATVLSNPSALVITFTRSFAGSYTLDSISFVRGKVIINNMNPYIESSWPIGITSVDFPKIAVSGGPPSATCEIKIPNSMSTTGTLISFSTSENGVLADDVLSKYLGFIEIRVYP